MSKRNRNNNQNTSGTQTDTVSQEDTNLEVNETTVSATQTEVVKDRSTTEHQGEAGGDSDGEAGGDSEGEATPTPEANETQVTLDTTAPSVQQPSESIFNQSTTGPKSEPALVAKVKESITNYATKCGRYTGINDNYINTTIEFMNGINAMLTLSGDDLKVCLATLKEAVTSSENEAFVIQNINKINSFPRNGGNITRVRLYVSFINMYMTWIGLEDKSTLSSIINIGYSLKGIKSDATRKQLTTIFGG